MRERGLESRGDEAERYCKDGVSAYIGYGECMKL